MNINYLTDSTHSRLCPDIKIEKNLVIGVLFSTNFTVSVYSYCSLLAALYPTAIIQVFFNSTESDHKASLFHHFRQPLPCIFHPSDLTEQAYFLT